MKPAPKNWTRFSSAVVYQDAAKAIDWLCNAFGFEVRLKVEGDGGVVQHSELTFGDGLVMIADERGGKRKDVGKSPRSVGGANTQMIMAYVDDAAAHLERAQQAGAVITHELETSDYGEDYWSDRGYQCEDLEGHRWWFCERLRDPK
jgi:uncharacterized glyoxalase superfamily protein PhnB